MTKKINFRSIAATVFSMVFVIVLGLSAVQNAEAQRRFDPKSVGAENELKNIGNFIPDVLEFVRQAQFIEHENGVSEADHKKLADLGRRIKNGTSGALSNLQALIQKLKSNNRWNDEFDADFLAAISNAKVKAFIQRIGGARKALTDAVAALNSLGQDVDATINEAKKTRAANDGGEVFFVNASFSSGGRKVRVKCVLLGIGVAAAEIGKLKLTAENLDNLFDSNKCGNAGAPTT